jgi:hypothetical protein
MKALPAIAGCDRESFAAKDRQKQSILIDCHPAARSFIDVHHWEELHELDETGRARACDHNGARQRRSRAGRGRGLSEQASASRGAVRRRRWFGHAGPHAGRLGFALSRASRSASTCSPAPRASIGTTEFVRSAKPDGYDLIITGTGATTVIPHSQKLSYDPIEDFEFVIGVVGLTTVVAVRKDFPAKDAKEFIEYVKANPGKVSLGHSGTGGEDWAMIRLLANGIGTDITDVPFDGAGPAATAAAGGHIDGAIGSLVAMTPVHGIG